MDWLNIHYILVLIQRTISIIGIFIIISGVFLAVSQYVLAFVNGQVLDQNEMINTIRLRLGRILILGLEFIVAADLIGTTTTPDYYEVGLLAIIVVIRTILSFSINRELMAISKE